VGLKAGVDFGALPPHFENHDIDRWLDTVGGWAQLMPDYEKCPASYKAMLPMMLASYTHHANWVADHVSGRHSIFTSRVARAVHDHRSLLVLDKAWLADHDDSGSGMEGTGMKVVYKLYTLAMAEKRDSEARHEEQRTEAAVRHAELIQMIQASNVSRPLPLPSCAEELPATFREAFHEPFMNRFMKTFMNPFTKLDKIPLCHFVKLLRGQSSRHTRALRFAGCKRR
jgi:hypothetical protein